MLAQGCQHGFVVVCSIDASQLLYEVVVGSTAVGLSQV